MSAVASKYIVKAEIELPMHRNRLRLLQQKIDALGLEVKFEHLLSEFDSAFRSSLPPK